MFVAPAGSSLGLCYSYTYDPGGELTNVSVGQYSTGAGSPPSSPSSTPIQGASVDYSYDSDGEIVEANSGAVSTSYVYNGLGQLIYLTNMAPSGTALSLFGDQPTLTPITYSWTGDTATMPYQLNFGTGQGISGTAQFQTDTARELIYEQWQLPTQPETYNSYQLPNGTLNQYYKYDPAGNLEMMREPQSTTDTYVLNDGTDQILNYANGSNGAFNYDADGDTLTDTNNYTLGYDVRGGLTSVAVPPGSTAMGGYVYTSDGWRASKTGDLFLYDGDNLIADFSSSGTMNHAYLWGATGLNTRVSNPLGGNLSYSVTGYSFDPSGNVVGRHPYGAQNPTETAQLFDAYGEPIFYEDNSTQDEAGDLDPIAYKGQFGCYTDHEVPASFALVYCHSRYYSPFLGRWLSRDPSGSEGGVHVYEYCGNNPISFSDPSGLFYIYHPSGTPSMPGIFDDCTGGYCSTVGNVFKGYGGAIFSMAKGAFESTPAYQIYAACHGQTPQPITWNGVKSAASNFWAGLTGERGANAFGQTSGTTLAVVGSVAACGASGAAELGAAGDAGAGEMSTVVEEVPQCVGPGTCFVAGTPIHIADDSLPNNLSWLGLDKTEPIEDLKPGTSVETSDPFQPSADVRKATAFYVLHATVLEDLSFADSVNGPVIQKLSCTPEHPFFTPRGQIYAGDLRKGDSVCTRDGHGMVLVGKTERHGSFTVYNLTVDKDHTYYVGTAHGGIWVHNGNCGLSAQIAAPGKFDATVGSRQEALDAVRAAFPNGEEAPEAFASPYPEHQSNQWFQVHPSEPGVANDEGLELPHIKYEDWLGGKKGRGGSWGHIFFPSGS